MQKVAILGAGNGGHPLVGLFRGTIKANLHSEGPPFLKMICYLRGDQGAVGEARDQEALPLGVGVNVQEIRTK